MFKIRIKLRYWYSGTCKVWKGSVTRFWTSIFFRNRSHLGPWKNLFLLRYSNSKFEKFDFLQANTARSQNFLFSWPFKKLTNNVGLYCNSSHKWLQFFSFFIQGKERTAKTKLFLAKLCAVLVTFRSLENWSVDSAQW